MGLAGLMQGCVGAPPAQEVARVDSLNAEAYRLRYRDVQASGRAAREAYDAAASYPEGRAEACNHMAFCHFLMMDFEEAERSYVEVAGLTRSELERLVADVGLMQVYQLTAMNRQYYLSRNAALSRLRRIADEPTAFQDPPSRGRLAMARANFWIVSARYHEGLEQDAQAEDCLYQLDVADLEADSGQWLAYHRLLGRMVLSSDVDPDERRMRQLDELFDTWFVARAGGYHYFERDALSGIGHLLIRPSVSDFMVVNRTRMLLQLALAVDTMPSTGPEANATASRTRTLDATGIMALTADTLLPLRLLQRALVDARQGGDQRQTADILVSIGKYLNAHGRYQEALDSLTQALEVYNAHHLRHRGQAATAHSLGHTTAHSRGLVNDSSRGHITDHSRSHVADAESLEEEALNHNATTHGEVMATPDLLQPTGRRDTLCTELRWMAQGERTVPEGIARIREQLSLAYAGLEQKESSDYNRNAYLDILDLTRQDREWESRTQDLEAESRRLGAVLCVLAACVLAWIALFAGLGRWSRRREQRQREQTDLVLDICRRISLSATDNLSTKEERAECILAAVAGPLSRLFGTTEISIDLDGRLQLPKGMEREKRAIARMLESYIVWAMSRCAISTMLATELELREKERYIHTRHITDGKRENMVKKACLSIVSGIRPYMDRLVHEIQSLTAPQATWPDAQRRQEQYQYAWELVTVINEYNDILARWVQLKPGQLSLNVETFPMDDLLGLLRKGEKTFAMRGLHLEVEPTAACVKADKALTLFMLNTLADNARKYTPAGGSVRVYVRQPDDGVVEVSVEDTGCGLTPEQAARLMGRESQPHEGSGFGLMNCKGIIEKYRKTGPLFRVCHLGVESEPGRGSRFYFRLPAGVRRALVVLGVMVSLCATLCGCRQGTVSGHNDADTLATQSPFLQDGRALQPFSSAGPLNDSVTAHAADTLIMRTGYEALLDSASLYANAAYYCNLDGQFAFALQYIDSALLCLNEHYARYAADPDGPHMALEGDGRAAELYWWDGPYNSDFHVILDVRNEAAVACLALKRWEAYTYNNNAYTGLYKLLGEDNTLETYCRQLERSRSNRTVGVYLAIIVLAFLLVEFCRTFIRRRLSMRWRLEQVMDVNLCMLTASMPPQSVVDELMEGTPALGTPTSAADEGSASSPSATPVTSISPPLDATAPTAESTSFCRLVSPQDVTRFLAQTHGSFCGLVMVDCIAIALWDTDAQSWLYAAYPERDLDAESGAEEAPIMLTLAKQCWQEQRRLAQGRLQAFPLIISPSNGNSPTDGNSPRDSNGPGDGNSSSEGDSPSDGDARYIGAFCMLTRSSDGLHAKDLPLVEQVVRQMAIVAERALLQPAAQCRAVEAARDEAARAAHEDSLIHVQNMVLDNCLSTIKHETIYYPSRIRLLIDRLRSGRLTEEEERDTLCSIDELLAYYQGMHTLLSRCADKQLEQVTFRRSAVAVADLLDGASRYLHRALRGRSGLTLRTGPLPQPAADTKVLGDAVLLRYLLESLLDEALSCPLPGELRLEAVDEGATVRFCLTDPRRTRSQDELDELFYPHLSHFAAGLEGQAGMSNAAGGRSPQSGLPGATAYLVGKQIIREHDHYAGRRGCRMGAEPVQDGPGFTVYFTLYKHQHLT